MTVEELEAGWSTQERPFSFDSGRVLMRAIASLVVLVSAFLATTACGSSESAADRAKSQACDAVSDIQTQVTTLKGLPLQTSSVDTAKTALRQIQADLKTISAQAPTVTGNLKTQLQTADATFKTQAQQAVESVTSAESLTAAATAVAAAGQTLETSYQQAFGDVKC